MKKLLLIGLMLLGIGAKAQQTEQYTQYMFNQFGLNPAFAGLKECIDLRFGFRAQWVGFEGAPRTAFANGNGRIFQRKTLHRYKHGLGVNAISDATGPTSRTFFDLAYAYHLKMNPKLWMSMGVAAGFLQYRFDASEVSLADNNDNAVNGSQAQFLVPDLNVGLLLYNEKFYLGLTMKQLWRNPIKNIFPDSRLTHHYYLNFGKKFTQDEISYTPSIMLKFAKLSVPALDLNFMVDYNNIIAVGLSYRNVDAIAAMFKVNFLQRFSFGYSFDFTTSQVRVGSSNTHEIILGVYSCPLGDPSTYECPAF